MIPRARQIRLAPLLATLLAALVLFGQSGAARRSATFDPQTPQNPTFRSGAYFVRVDAYPRKDGRIVDGLTRDDFEILEDGKPQKVETSEFFRIDTNQLQAFRRDPASIEESNAAVADPANRVFVIYLDTYHVSVEGSHAARQPLITMLDRLLMPNDLFGVITPEMRARDLTFARKTNTIADMLTRDWAWGQRDSGQRDPDEEALHNCFAVNPSTGSGSPWMVEDDGLRRELSNVLIDRRREDITLSKLEELVNYLAKIREERKSLIVFTTGWRLFREDLALAAQAQPGIPLRCNGELTRLAAIDDQQRMRDVIAASNRGNVTFYPVNPQGLIAFDSPINEHVEPSQSALAAGGGSPLVADQNRLRARTDALMTLASNTDGIAVVNTNDLNKGIDRIIEDLSAYYVLGYYTSNAKFDGKYRKLEVRVKQSGVKVTARRGYVSPTAAEVAARDAPPAPQPTAAETAVPDALAALARLRPSAEVYGYGITTGSAPEELAIVAEISSDLVEAGKWANGADVQFVVTTPSGESVGTASAHIDAGARGAVVRMPAGSSSGPWRVGVKLRGASTEGIDDAFAVAKTANTVLAEPLVSRGGPGTRSRLQPVADFAFRRTERVHVEWRELKALDARQARFLDRTGKVLPIDVTLTDRVEAAGTTLAADVSLAPLGPGDYLIELTATSGAESIRKLLAIRVRP